MTEDSLLRFPCDLPIKVFGRNRPGFREAVLTIVRSHVVGEPEVNEQLSREGRFVSLTVTIRVENKADVDAIYVDLSANHEVLMAL